MTEEEEKNPFLLMGFWEFTIISTLVCAFFPWSLLFCLLVYGMDVTKFLIIAMLHDSVKLIGAIIGAIIGIIALGFILYWAWGWLNYFYSS